jgi:hypothetical protein
MWTHDCSCRCLTKRCDSFAWLDDCQLWGAVVRYCQILSRNLSKWTEWNGDYCHPRLLVSGPRFVARISYIRRADVPRPFMVLCVPLLSNELISRRVFNSAASQAISRKFCLQMAVCVLRYSHNWCVEDYRPRSHYEGNIYIAEKTMRTSHLTFP